MRAGLQLALVLRLIIVPLRLRDQAIGTNCPFLVPLDPNGLASAPRARVRTGPDPPEDCVATIPADFIHRHHHVWISTQESLGRCGNRRAADRGSTGIDG